ncbi:MAG: hypothetical protein AB4042_08965, partial [Leptolyngbyaceae cyanobacterium]
MQRIRVLMLLAAGSIGIPLFASISLAMAGIRLNRTAPSLAQTTPMIPTLPSKESTEKSSDREDEMIPLPSSSVSTQTVSNPVQILACNGIFPASANLRIGPGDRQIGVVGHKEWVQVIGEKSGNYFPV